MAFATRLYLRQCGVTFLELLVAIAILGILAAIAAPYYGNYIERQRWQGATEALLGKVQQAKRAAISNNKTIFLIAQGTGSTDWCVTFSEVSTAGAGCSAAYVTSSLANPSLILASADYPTVQLDSSLALTTPDDVVLSFEMPGLRIDSAHELILSTSIARTKISVTPPMSLTVTCADGSKYPGC